MKPKTVYQRDRFRVVQVEAGRFVTERLVDYTDALGKTVQRWTATAERGQVLALIQLGLIQVGKVPA